MPPSVDSDSDGYASDPEEVYDFEMGVPMVAISQTRREALAWEPVIPAHIFDGNAASLVTLLARPTLPGSLSFAPGLGQAKPDASIEITVPGADASIAGVPFGILSIILDYLTVDDVFFFGLTSRSAWNLAARIIRTFILERLGTWAGTQLVSVPAVHRRFKRAAYMKIQTLPTEEDGRTCNMAHAPTIINRTSLSLQHMSRCKYRLVTYDHVKPVYPHVFLAYPKPGPGHIHWLGGPPTVDRRIRYPRPSPYFPDKDRWILRNLTTREFVRADAIALKGEFIEGPFIAGLGFGEVLSSRITWLPPIEVWDHYDCWQYMTAGQYLPRFYWGSWAGHRFDIVPEQYLERDYDGEAAEEAKTEMEGEWKDVSEEVMSDFARMAEIRFGENWRDVLVREVLKVRPERGLQYLRYVRETEEYVLRKQENYD